MRIIAYTYLADVHCPTCTREAVADGALVRKEPLWFNTDEHDLHQDLVDREGNPIHPVFDIDEDLPTHCGDCLREL